MATAFCTPHCEKLKLAGWPRFCLFAKGQVEYEMRDACEETAISTIFFSNSKLLFCIPRRGLQVSPVIVRHGHGGYVYSAQAEATAMDHMHVDRGGSGAAIAGCHPGSLTDSQGDHLPFLCDALCRNDRQDETGTL